ncbi:hypothetical protein [Phaeobacter gallaeciensis]|nr:hypothetical protein [Phaeobacter gallaeciensis]
MTITVRTAPTVARKLVKQAPYTRRQIQQASKAEESGTAGATRERESLTAKFARDIRQAEAAISGTRAKAADFERAALTLHTKTHGRDKPMARLCALAGQLGGVMTPELASTLDHAAKRAADAADAAQDRLDNADAELRSTALLAQLSAHLPAVKFDSKHPSVAGIRRDYLSASQIAADRRKKAQP